MKKLKELIIDRIDELHRQLADPFIGDNYFYATQDALNLNLRLLKQYEEQEEKVKRFRRMMLYEQR